MKDVWVISLGGSRIVPDNVDDVFLKRFRKLIDTHKDKRFVIVCGGGRTARRYMSALKRLGKSTGEQSIEGIAVTRLHAGFMTRFFGSEANEVIPRSMGKVKGLLRKNRVIFCGALRWRENNTSDGNAAQLAGYFGCHFINLTDVRGLYSENPKKNKRAKFISKISWKDFLKMAKGIKYEAGQHFVLDLAAAEEILKRKIVTYIVGSLKSVDNILLGPSTGMTLVSLKKFDGTVISG